MTIYRKLPGPATLIYFETRRRHAADSYFGLNGRNRRINNGLFVKTRDENHERVHVRD